MALGAMEAMRFFYDKFQVLFQTADIGLLLASIMPRVCLFVILHRKKFSAGSRNCQVRILETDVFFLLKMLHPYKEEFV